MNRKHFMTMLLGLCPATLFAQRGSQTSQYIVAGAYNALPVVYNINEEIATKTIPSNPVKWGLDVAWDWDQNILRGVNFLNKDVVKIGRVSFQATDVVGEDFVLSSAQQAALQNRLNLIGKTGVTDIAFNHDNGQWSDPQKGPTYKANYYGKPVNWYRVIKASVLYARQKGFNVVTISPFNEPDYKGWADPEIGLKEGWTDQGTVAHFKEVARLLTEDKDLAGIRISAGNTLNCDEALTWYNGVQPYVTEGNTHQLSGTLSSYANFWKTVRNNGHVATADELHNTMEAFVAVHYGMQQGIWWGWEAACRSEFCDASYFGKEIGYNENRSAWSAATVYKREGGRIDAFAGGSERQAYTSSYDFVSLDRPAYYDSYGPVYSYSLEIPGGTGYQQGQTNAERMINITYGEDAPTRALLEEQVYVIMNKGSKLCIGPSGGSTVDGAIIIQDDYGSTSASAKPNLWQQWKIQAVSPTIGGEFGYYYIKSNYNTNQKLDIKDWSLDSSAEMILYNGSGGTNEQWSFIYAGDGDYYIRSRHSGLYLGMVSGNYGAKLRQQEFTGSDLQRWRFIQGDSPLSLTAPKAPSNLVLTPQSASVKLTWTKSTTRSTVVGYNIYRTTADPTSATSTDWDVIGRVVPTLEFIDNDVMQGKTYYYKVRTLDKACNLSTATDIQSIEIPESKDLIAHFPFTTDSYDTSENILDAVTSSGATYSTTQYKIGNGSLFLNGKGSYVKLPCGIINSQMTIALWAYVSNTTKAWQRVFDFGNGENQYMFFTPNNGSEARFVMKNGGNEEILSTSKLSAGWHYIAVTISNERVALYIDGDLKDYSDAMTIRPLDIKPRLNYVGRSQFASDPLFAGYINDLRIYNYPLTGDDITKLYNGKEPTNLKEIKENNKNHDTYIYDISGKRYTTPQKGLNIIGGKKVVFK